MAAKREPIRHRQLEAFGPVLVLLVVLGIACREPPFRVYAAERVVVLVAGVVAAELQNWCWRGARFDVC